MTRLEWEQPVAIGRWVADRIGIEDSWGPHQAVGQIRDDRLIAAVVYNRYSHPDICIHVAAVPDVRWMTRGFMHAVFHYPFLQLQVRRVTAVVAAKNVLISTRFHERLGFKLEGYLRHALKDDDMYLFGMLKSECRWLKEP